MTPQELEELSFRNLVEYNREELTKIMNGARASDIFTETHRRGLIKNGVIRQGSRFKRTVPTPRAVEILEGQESSGSATR